MRPLEGRTVLEFAQYVAGPSAGLHLSNKGAPAMTTILPAGKKVTPEDR